MERRIGQGRVGEEKPIPIGEYTKSIAGIRARLDRGTDTIKRGHSVTGLSHAGETTVIPLTERQIARLNWHLDVVQYKMTHGGPKAGLPYELRFADPNHYRKIDGV